MVTFPCKAWFTLRASIFFSFYDVNKIYTKSETQNPNFETNSKFQSSNDLDVTGILFLMIKFLTFEFLPFEIVSDFDIRI